MSNGLDSCCDNVQAPRGCIWLPNIGSNLCTYVSQYSETGHDLTPDAKRRGSGFQLAKPMTQAEARWQSGPVHTRELTKLAMSHRMLAQKRASYHLDDLNVRKPQTSQQRMNDSSICCPLIISNKAALF
eukprot:CAMPEP_0174384598 /NCGR_PEP_ID=MMETSP0811_2-20130205/126028_1 /TAXON_ID=73025 ORGANISM="Eutreptiella gymnastica-like, Strain CCMP1594" /NCGR_SAMPLE_ID=MMETSP0811_2 /ASSEMBLY_ACC=CAM_ASM_000667 /LENGTH=128 /DNA_ID=CAMNT_0015538615 /DNA_START=47 /DNA_END=433 /DNA_ORIENTATION=-